MTLRAAVAVIAVALATTLAGCGSTGDPAGAPTSGTTAATGGLGGFVQDIGAELNEYWGAEWGDGWRPALITAPETEAQTACGTIDAADSGPAYCSGDDTMVLPLAFFRDNLVGADDAGANDAAVAGVVGHEFGHHLQALSGIEAEITAAQAEVPEFANLLSVANELNADCLMGVWMSSVDDEKRLEPGDLDEVLAILARIGDDQLSADAGVDADAATFDHGTSEQRRTWFAVGYEQQDVAACNAVFGGIGDGTLQGGLEAGADQANGAARG